ncbi:MAG TPA: VWA domain-containing protein, partial [Blastocatellia bacterium]|nr:VWA domain-containing protein [Blastocatellia bacterium]
MRIAPFQKMRLWLVGLGCLLGLLSVFFTQFNKAQAQGAKEKTLVTVPVIVTDKGDSYVTELKQEDFTVYEDSVKQQIASFAPVKSPVNVVLLLGTGDYSSEKVKSIQRSAIEFLEFVEYSDRIKVISFDSQVRELCDFTSSQAVLRKAITSAETGRGAKLYEAFKLALKSLEPLKGHKAIVFFTDGVDMNSAASSYEENIRLLEESGVIVYPIRYESRADKERLARDQLAGNTRRSANDDDGSVSDSRNP